MSLTQHWMKKCESWRNRMKTIITIQHTQSVHHTNGMVGSWTDWELSELGVEQAKKIGEKLKAELNLITQKIAAIDESKKE